MTSDPTRRALAARRAQMSEELGRWRRIVVTCPSHRGSEGRKVISFVSLDRDPWYEERPSRASHKREAQAARERAEARRQERGDGDFDLGAWIAGTPDADAGHMVRVWEDGKVEEDATPPLPQLLGAPALEGRFRENFEIRCRCGDYVPVRDERLQPILNHLYDALGLRAVTLGGLRAVYQRSLGDLR